MLRFLLILAVCGTAFAGAPAKKVVRLVEDKAVIGGAVFRSHPMMEIRNLRFYDAKLAETGAQCTVVVGELWNMTDGEGWAADIEIDMWVGGGDATLHQTVVTHIERPGKKVPVLFSLIGPACYDKVNWDGGCRLMHCARVKVVHPKPLAQK